MDIKRDKRLVRIDTCDLVAELIRRPGARLALRTSDHGPVPLTVEGPCVVLVVID